MSTRRCVLVSHTHWDREWYRTYQAFRARLVDTVDRVLDLVREDSGFFFQLDGQAIVIEDYLEIRPQRSKELAAACAAGRVAVGPWYVQPDSLLPSGETHLRNLLEGRRVANRLSHSSQIAYTPDSFGHPAQFPQLFAGFGLEPFVYWRGHGNELDELPAEYHWRAPDGSEIRACHLGKGYFAAWGLGSDSDAGSQRLEGLADELAERATSEVVLLMNGIDHMLPDAHTREMTAALHKNTGWEVVRGLLDDYVENLGELSEHFSGELLGARGAHLLPGVWSTHMPLKLHNRRCEALLEGWTEPWAALSRILGEGDEAPAIRSAWRQLLPNQAHDSICGCSQDRVHEQMVYRYQNVEELASETTLRVLERLAGSGLERQDTAREPLEVTVFNPSPHPRSDVVRLSLEGYPAFSSRGINPLLQANLGIEGFEVDGQPARVLRHTANVRPELRLGAPVHDLEFIAGDVPAFGCRRFSLTPSARVGDSVDTEPEIRGGSLTVSAEAAGTFSVSFTGRTFSGLGALEDLGDRGDTYDFDAVGEPRAPEVVEVKIQRRRHPSGIEVLEIGRRLRVPARLREDRQQRSDETVSLWVHMQLRVFSGKQRVDLRVRVENTAEDHRLRLLFPTGTATTHFHAATTFDICERNNLPPDDSQWVQRAPQTFPHQGWICANELSVVAPGLPEGEVLPNGDIAVTLLRSVGWLSRPDLVSRPGEAGPALRTPRAQCLGTLEAELSLLPGLDPAGARDAELGLRAVASGNAPLLAPEQPLLQIEPRELLLSALKPADDGDGSVIRLLNPSDQELSAHIEFGFECSEVTPVRLDETPLSESHGATPQEGSPELEAGRSLRFRVRPHGMRSFRLRTPDRG